MIKATTPLMRRAAGHRFLPIWAVLQHVGRKSGTPYEIPIAVLVTADTFVIGMPWGRQTNWVQNVRAAGGCTIRWKGVDYACTEPRFVDRDVALAAANGFERLALRRVPIRDFLQVRRRKA